MFSLTSVYIACTIFGAGVTTIDMLGLLGDLFHESGGAHDASSHNDHGGFHGDHTGAYGEHGNFHGDHGGVHSDHDMSVGEHAGAHADAQGHSEELAHADKGSVSAHETYVERNVLGQILSIARSLVHFSLGFGPVGLFATLTGRGALASVAWSVPVGVVAMIGGRLLRQLQRQRLDSQLTDADMIMERGEVLVSIGQGQIGKVRLLVEGIYAERYARAHDPTKSLPVGTSVRVVDVSEECVYVEEE